MLTSLIRRSPLLGGDPIHTEISDNRPSSIELKLHDNSRENRIIGKCTSVHSTLAGDVANMFCAVVTLT